MENCFRIFDSISTGVFAVDCNYRIHYWNDLMEGWTSVKADELFGQNLFEIFPAFNNPFIKIRINSLFEFGTPAILSSSLHNNLFKTELVNRSKYSAFEITISLLQKSEPVAEEYAIFTVNNVSDLKNKIEALNYQFDVAEKEIQKRKKIEKELQASNNELKTVAAELDQIFKNTPFTHLLLNEAKQVLKLNNQDISVSGNGKIIKYPGNLLHCVHVSGTNHLCGSLDICKGCFTNKVFSKTLQTKQDQNEEGSVTLIIDGKPQERHVNMSTAVFYNSQNKLRILVSLFDITESKILTQNLEKANEKLYVSNKELLETTKALSERENQLSESQQHFKGLSDATVEGLVIHKNGTFIEVNKTFCKLFGYEHDELIGQNFLQLMIPKEHHQTLIEKFSTSNSGEYDFEAIHKNGSRIPVEVVSQFITWKGEQVRVASVKNLTERRKQQMLLKQSEQRFREMVEYSAFAYQSLNEQGEFIDVNDALQHLLGYSKKELLGKKFGELWIEPESKDFTAKFDEFKKKGYVHTTIKIRTRNRGVVSVILNGNIQRDSNKKMIKSHCVLTDITQQQQQEQKAIKAQQRLTIATEVANMTTWEYIVAEDKTIASPLYVSLLGFNPEDGGVSSKWITGLHPNDKEATLNALTNTLKGITDSYHAEFRYRRSDSEDYFWMLGLGRITERNADGTAKVLMGVNQDITKRKNAEEEEQLTKKRVETLLRIANYNIEDTQGFLDFALSEVLALTDSEIGYFFRYDEATQVFTLEKLSDAAMSGCEVANPRIEYNLKDAGLWGEVVRQQQPVIVNNYHSKHPWAKGTPKGHLKLNKFMAIPIFKGRRIVGTVGVANKGADYTSMDTYQLSILIDSVWRKIENFETDKLLAETTQNLELAMKSANMGVWKFDFVTRQMEIDSTIQSYYEIENDDYDKSAETFYKLVHPDDVERQRYKLLNTIRKNSTDYTDTYRIISKSNKIKHIYSVGKFRYNSEGVPQKAFGIMWDISNFKKLEEKLYKEKINAESVIDATQAGTWYWKVQDDDLTINERWAEIIGYKLSELCPISIQTWNESVHPDDLPNAQIEINRLFSEEIEYYSIEFRQKHKNGHWVWVQARGKVFEWSNDRKPILACGTHLNITKRKAAELELKESEEKYRFLANSVNDIVWKADFNLNFTYVSPAVYKMRGLTVEEAQNRPVEKNFPPETIEKSKNALMQRLEMVKAGDPQGWEPVILDVQMYKKDNSLFWAQVSAQLVGENGIPTEVVGVTRDISQQKKISLQLEHNTRMLKMAQQIGKIGHWMLDIPNDKLEWSDEVYRIFDLDSNTLINSYKDFLKLVHPDDRTKVDDSYNLSLKNKTDYLIKHRVFVPNNKVKWVAEKCTTTYNEYGEPLKSIGTIQDITKQVESEAALIDSEKKYRALFEKTINPVLIISDGRFTDCNQATVEVLGYASKEELLDKIEPWQISPERQPSGEYSKELSEKHMQIAYDEGYNYFDWVHKTKNGNEIWFSIALTKIKENDKESLYVVWHNINDKKLTEKALNDKNVQLAQALEEKEVLLKEIHHRVKNNLQTVRTLLFKQQNTTNNSEIKQVLQDSMDRVNAMATVHEQIYKSKDIQNVNFDKYIKEIASQLFYTHRPTGKNIQFNIDSENVALPLHKAVPVALLINELISNALKYAFSNTNDGVIKVLFSKTDDGFIQIYVSDNGIGLPEGFDINKAESMGMYIVNSIATRQLLGTINIKSNKGTTFIITFKQ